MKKYFALLLLFYALSNSQMLGQSNTITTAVPFLLFSPDSRGSGMGDAGCATSPDIFSTHWNASLLAFAKNKIGLGISYKPWLRAIIPDANFAYISCFFKPRISGVFAASYRIFSLGNITYTSVTGTPIGQYKPIEQAIDMSYARLLGKNFSMAISMRYINSSLTGGIAINGASSHAGTSIAGDVSANYRTTKSFFGKSTVYSTGINISNMGQKITYTHVTRDTADFIPTNLRIGQAVDIELDNYNSLSFCLDFNKLLVPTPDTNVSYIGVPFWKAILPSFTDAPGGLKEEMDEIIICGGLEYWYGKPKIFGFRTGYFNEAATKGNRKYFTFGIGVRYDAFGLDISYIISTMKQYRYTNRIGFSLTFNFGNPKEPPAIVEPTF